MYENNNYIAENGWFDSETLSIQEEDRSTLLEFNKQWIEYRNMFIKHRHDETSKYQKFFTAIQDFHWYGDDGFLGKVKQGRLFAYQAGVMPSYASTKKAFAAAEKYDLSKDELAGLLWRRVRLGAERSRELRSGGLSSLVEVFPEIFAENSSYEITSQTARTKFQQAYLYMLAASIGGAVKEFQVYQYLKGIYGDQVVWGTDKDDTIDIDLFLNGNAISVKSSNGMNERNIDKYRKKGHRDPVAYVEAKFYKGKVSGLAVLLPLADWGSYEKTDEKGLKQFSRSKASNTDEFANLLGGWDISPTTLF